LRSSENIKTIYLNKKGINYGAMADKKQIQKWLDDGTITESQAVKMLLGSKPEKSENKREPEKKEEKKSESGQTNLKFKIFIVSLLMSIISMIGRVISSYLGTNFVGRYGELFRVWNMPSTIPFTPIMIPFISIPSIIVIVSTVFFMYKQKEQTKKALYRVPIRVVLLFLALSVIISIVMVIAVTNSGSVEAGMGLIIIPLLFLTSITMVPLISLIITTFLYFFYDFRKLVIVLGIIILVLVLTAALTLNAKNCRPADFRCWERKALESRDPSICSKGSIFPDGVRVCYSNYASETKDVSVCAMDWKIENQDSLRELCYRDVARTTNNASICNLIKLSEYHRDECYIDVVKNTRDAALCENVIHHKDECIRYTAS